MRIESCLCEIQINEMCELHTFSDKCIERNIPLKFESSRKVAFYHKN